jgi:hypothetical protein
MAIIIFELSGKNLDCVAVEQIESVTVAIQHEIMKLYLISQDQNNDYDTYDSAVVCAKSEEEARNIHPNVFSDDPWEDSGAWCSSPDLVTVIEIGVANPSQAPGIVCSSFNAG